MKQRRLAILAVLLVLASSAVWAAKHKKPPAASQMDEHKRALHVLNRFTFGPRPGEVDRVASSGVDKWFEQQLQPDKIDDSALQARLAPYRTLNMDARELLQNFPPPQVIKAVESGKISEPSDPAKKAIYDAQMQRLEQRQERKQEKGQVVEASAANGDPADAATMTDDQRAARREARMYAEENAERIISLPADKRMQAILQMTPEQRQALARSLSPEQREQLMNSLTPQQREQLQAMANPQAVVTNELMQGKILREAYSERQLEEVMTDFWFNHFNVFIGKGPDRYMVGSYERDVIRPHALGKFKDLLLATAKSPAMLFYLDNAESVGPDSPAGTGQPARRNNGGFRPAMRRGGFGGPFGGPFGRPFPPPRPRAQRPQQQQQANKPKRGINENYGRELMELHTLGVAAFNAPGGYTQKDVQEVAKVFTGWTINQPRLGGGFEFNERMHEPGTKVVLGHKIKENGAKEGEEVLALLVKSPYTARFISTKLAMRFVSDDPPKSLVDRMAQAFQKSDGDIREVLRAMYQSPEFWQADTYRAKVKTPLEFVVSAVRATGAEVSNAQPIIQTLNQMGMPLYGAQPPTGYSMKADTWVNSAALLNRMNFALRFASGRMPGVSLDPQRVLGSEPPGDPESAVARVEAALLAGDVSQQTHETVLKQMTDPQVTQRVLDDASRPVNVGVIAALILGSPEFQRR